MITNWPLVFFTVFSQFATGLALFSWWRDTHDEVRTPCGWRAALGASVVGLIGSVICYGGLASGAMLMSQLACAVLVVCCALALKGCTVCGLAAWIVGAVCVLGHIIDAIPGELFTTSGMFPVLLFPLCTVILGAAYSQVEWMGQPADHKKHPLGRFYLPLRACLWVMLVITAIAPIIPWEDTYMARSAIILMQTQLYWMGCIFSGVVIGLQLMGRITLGLQAIIAFISIFGLRTAFYADGIHGIIDMSTIYRPF